MRRPRGVDGKIVAADCFADVPCNKSLSTNSEENSLGYSRVCRKVVVR